jgi:hypothetical protein
MGEIGEGADQKEDRKQKEGSNRHNFVRYSIHRPNKRKQSRIVQSRILEASQGTVVEILSWEKRIQINTHAEVPREITTREYLLLLILGKHKRRS